MTKSTNFTGVFANPVPRLEGEAAAARDYRGGHLQIIASAGSGKTEVVSQRVATLLAEDTPAAAIVAFTFTERAAASLKARIERCVLAHPKLGQPALDRIASAKTVSLRPHRGIDNACSFHHAFARRFFRNA